MHSIGIDAAPIPCQALVRFYGFDDGKAQSCPQGADGLVGYINTPNPQRNSSGSERKAQVLGGSDSTLQPFSLQLVCRKEARACPEDVCVCETPKPYLSFFPSHKEECLSIAGGLFSD